MKPKVSVIIPCYNASLYIEECLSSLFLQSYSNIEIIAVNDGSTDDTYDILRKYDDKIIVLTQENKGASTARNLGLSKASGDFIQFLDADDAIDKDKIKTQFELIEANHLSSETLVFGEWAKLGMNVDALSANQKQIWHDYLDPLDLLFDYVKFRCCLPPLCFLTSKELISKAGLWDESLSLNDDGEFFARVISVCDRICFCKGSTSFYRSTPNSLSKQVSRKAVHSQMCSLIKISNIMKKSIREDRNDTIVDMISSSLRRFYPYYRKERKIGEDYILSIDSSYTFQYLKLNLKESLFYLFQLIKHPNVF